MILYVLSKPNNEFEQLGLKTEQHKSFTRNLIYWKLFEIHFIFILLLLRGSVESVFFSVCFTVAYQVYAIS